MKAVLLDTHTWAWGLYRSYNISARGRAAIEAAGTVWISPISFYEIAQKVRLRKWPEMEPFVSGLFAESQRQMSQLARLDSEICLHAGLLDWSNRDPFDRVLAITALHYGVPIVSADAVFDGIVARIW